MGGGLPVRVVSSWGVGRELPVRVVRHVGSSGRPPQQGPIGPNINVTKYSEQGGSNYV